MPGQPSCRTDVRPDRHNTITALLAALLLWAAPTARAQVPPSPEEIARYEGLHAVAHRDDAASVARLAAASPATLERRDAHGRTPLHVATHARAHAAIAALIRAGADTRALDHDRYDAVTIASVANDEPGLRVLLSMGARADLITSRYDGTALIAAAHLGHAGIVRQLIASGARLDHVNNLHWAALIESIVLGDGGARHLATLEALLDAGANPLLTDREGRTPLQLARARGYAAMVSRLERAEARARRVTACPPAPARWTACGTAATSAG